MTLYETVAEKVQRMIEGGAFQPGDRIPSVRRLAKELDVSVTTVVEAYTLLESRGRLEARPQSGYYVTERFPVACGQIAASQPPARPVAVGVDELVMQIQRDTRDPDLVQLGAAVPNPAMLPLGRLDRLLASAARRLGPESQRYDFPPGCRELRVQVARRLVARGCTLGPDDLVVTNGCLEALNLALRAVCREGDTVAVESPTYFGLLQALQHLRLRALEIPTHPRTGLSVEALRFALDHQEVRAVVATPNFQNPLGSRMPDEAKRDLVDLLAGRGIPLVEDDIFGDLSFSGDRPVVCQAFDREGLVLLCSSFSKDLAPAWRVGWIAAGRFRDKVMQLKASTNVASATLPPLAIAEFLATGGYERHLRMVRRSYACQTAQLARAVLKFFPEGTKVSLPQGGFVVWVELPPGGDSMVLHERALERGITIAPGPIFSAKGDYRRFLRLNATGFSDREERSIAVLGGLI